MTLSAPRVVTFGCRLNTYESEVMAAHASGAGLNDAIIVNTCAVTAEAERQARQDIRRLARENPNAKIIVTGCAAQIHPESFAELPGVAHVVGNDAKLKAETWQNLGEKILVNDIMAVRETAGHLLQGFETRSRGFLQVQNGCDHRCTFCIIPYGRGNSRSVPIASIADQIRILAENGVQEVVLTGVDITSYGTDLPGTPKLGQMMRRVMALVPEMPRWRLSSLDPSEIDEDMWNLIAEEPRLMPHLHLSVQAGDDMVLKRMKRRHLRHHILEVTQKAKALRPDMAFGADIIAGFPTETDDMFERTLAVVDEADLTFLHVFPYSARTGTPAAKMPQVPVPLRKERAARLREAGHRRQKLMFNALLGKEVQVLVEKDGKGHTEHFAPVKIDAPDGVIVRANIKGADDRALFAEAV